jgi:hypothetical protein
MYKIEPTADMEKLLSAVASQSNEAAAWRAQQDLAIALTTPLRQGMMNGANHAGIFEQTTVKVGTVYEYPLDFFAPGTEKEFIGYVIPSLGAQPSKHVEGDYVAVPTYWTGNNIGTSMDYVENSGWDVIGRMLQVLEAGMVKKDNDDAWHCLLGAATDRNIIVADSSAQSGQFTKRLISLAKVVMRRNGGGNSTSVNRSKLTDIYLSPELIEDMRNWGVDQVDEVTRREIYVADDNSERFQRVFGVNLHDMDEFGEAQEYHNYFTGELGGSTATGDLEILVGLDLSKNDSFLNPVAKPLSVKPDPWLERDFRIGYYCRKRAGWAVLDGRRTILLSA